MTIRGHIYARAVAVYFLTLFASIFVGMLLVGFDTRTVTRWEFLFLSLCSVFGGILGLVVARKYCIREMHKALGEYCAKGFEPR